MAFIDTIKAKAKADKKTIVLPESMDKRTFEAAEKILKEGIANLVIIGTPAMTSLVQPSLIRLQIRTVRSTSTSSSSFVRRRALPRSRLRSR